MITMTITLTNLVIVPSCESHSIAVDQAVHKPVPDDDDSDDDEEFFSGTGWFSSERTILPSSHTTVLKTWIPTPGCERVREIHCPSVYISHLR